MDSYVLETNVHYPTDLNLLCDAARKSIEILCSLYEQLGLQGWRKKAYWKRQFKQALRACAKINRSGGANKALRLEVAVKDYLEAAYALEAKLYEWVQKLQSKEVTLSITESLPLKSALYFHDHLIGYIDLIERRLLKGEKIPHEEKVFSLFEPHTDLIKKGKSNPAVEFGRRLLVSTQQDGLILDYKVMGSGSETAEVVPLADRLLNGYGEGNLKSISFDKGFAGYKRYVGLGILAYNLHKIGARSSTQKRTPVLPFLNCKFGCRFLSQNQRLNR